MRGSLLAVACVACGGSPSIDGTYDVMLTAVSGSACAPLPLDSQLETITISGSDRVNVEKSSAPLANGEVVNAAVDGLDLSFAIDLTFPDGNRFDTGHETYMLHADGALTGTVAGSYTFQNVPCARTFDVMGTMAAARTDELR